MQGGLPSQNPGATGNIQHSLARADPGRRDNFGSPLLKEGRGLEILVRVGGRDLLLGCCAVHLLRLRHLTNVVGGPKGNNQSPDLDP
jgi:hypothetical protein